MLGHPWTSLACVASLLVSSCGARTDQEDQTQSLIETREEVGRAVAEGDMERVFSFWSDDVVIYPVSEPAARGIDAVRAYVIRNRRELGIRPRLTPVDVVASASGDIAYVFGTHDWVDRDGRISNPGRYVTLWRRNDEGDWKMFLEIHSPRPAEEAAGTEAP